MNTRHVAAQLRRALELFAQTVLDESVMMQIADMYPPFAWKRAYTVGEVFRWGIHSDGETQLYQVLQDHTSSEEWPPDIASGLYKAVGVTASGLFIWTQPLGATDAYRLGDRVMHNGLIWVCSDVDAAGNNVWEPGVFGWAEEPTKQEA